MAATDAKNAKLVTRQGSVVQGWLETGGQRAAADQRGAAKAKISSPSSSPTATGSPTTARDSSTEVSFDKEHWMARFFVQ
eukprot:Skav222878  [mRNA]  locus=scaffold1102:25641:26337:- [translate_table: standard]